MTPRAFRDMRRSCSPMADKKGKIQKGREILKERATHPILQHEAIPVEDNEFTPGPLVILMISQSAQEDP